MMEFIFQRAWHSGLPGASNWLRRSPDCCSGCCCYLFDSACCNWIRHISAGGTHYSRDICRWIRWWNIDVRLFDRRTSFRSNIGHFRKPLNASICCFAVAAGTTAPATYDYGYAARTAPAAAYDTTKTYYQQTAPATQAYTSAADYQGTSFANLIQGDDRFLIWIVCCPISRIQISWRCILLVQEALRTFSGFKFTLNGLNFVVNSLDCQCTLLFCFCC